MYVCMLDKKKKEKNKCPGFKPGEILRRRRMRGSIDRKVES